MVNNHGIQTVSMVNGWKKSEKSMEKKSSAAEGTKFPYPVPAMKRELSPVKAWAKPVKTSETLVCPWPKCIIEGDKVFLARHLRVHEKFSNQV